MAHAVATLVEILEQDQHHLDLIDCKNQIESFLDKARSFRDTILVLITPTLYLISPDLDMRIIDAAHKAEDVIEVHIRNQILLPPEDHEVVSQLEDHLTDLVQEFESIKEEILKIADDPGKMQPLLPMHHSPSEVVPWYPKLDPCTRNDVPVFEDDFQALKLRIIQGPTRLQIISIDGMWGMGKKTLARRLHNDSLIASHFHIRAWVSSPFGISVRSCLLNLLDGLGKLTNEMHGENVDQLKAHVHNALMKRKYFIVIHDVMEYENWVTFTRLFRNYGVRARILFTTWEINQETSSTHEEPHLMRFLTDSESWLLLRQKVFGRELCTDQLEPIGKVIMKACKGVPQVVSLIAGFLATSERTPAAWELVATTLCWLLKDVPIDRIHQDLLCVVYGHLPYYLRSCLLYVSAFYESCDIKASKIIKLWIAEGFVKRKAGECLEDVAETYLRILIDMNLLSLTHQEPNGRVKAFQLQLPLRIVYWGLATREKFLGSKFLHLFMDKEDEMIERRVSLHGLFEPSNEMDLTSLARSFLSISGASPRQVSAYLKLRLLRVLEVFQLEFYQFPIEIMQLVLLRYLAFSCHSNLPNSFYTLGNLQILIIRRLSTFRAFSLPSDLWGLTQLRHVKCKETFILRYPTNGKEVVHGNLQTLSNMQLFGVTNQFLRQIPNIRKLGIFCNIVMETVFDLARLDKLETLKCSSDWSLASRNFLSYLTLPKSLREVTLSLCRISSEFMKVVGSLPNL